MSEHVKIRDHELQVRQQLFELALLRHAGDMRARRPEPALYGLTDAQVKQVTKRANALVERIRD